MSRRILASALVVAATSALVGTSAVLVPATASAAPAPFTLFCFPFASNNIDRYTFRGTLDSDPFTSRFTNVTLTSDKWVTQDYGPATNRGFIPSITTKTSNASGACYDLDARLGVTNYKYGYWA